ncbi:MAG: HPP family protein [Candidatus Acidiferrales bacterium]
MKRRADLIWALAEGSLMLAMAAISWATRQPLIFASLGPTAYELVEQPQLRSARSYNIIVGHLAGLGSGFLAIYVFNAWNSPAVLSAGVLTTNRLWVVALAAALTTVLTLLLRAGQPAALATTLLVALGLMQTRRDAIAIIAGVIIMAAIGEPLRRLRLKILEMRSMPTTPIPR